MRIVSLKINKFRAFTNAEFIIGKNITVLSGSNAVGKSTILGLLGNSCELKTEKGKPILQPSFRCEWGELFKMSPSFDTTSSNVASISYEGESDLKYRITWQENGTRGRLIPSTTTATGIQTNAKKEYPSLYLGLSRLYPLGESTISATTAPTTVDVDPSSFLETYCKILSIHDEIQSVNRITVDVTKRTPIGVNTDKYDYLTNSAGQDNLAQILLAVESFRKLKNEQSTDYKWGLLLIDEIDAALHPSAQNKLFNYLYESSKELNLQIVFTTHSLSLLDHARLFAKSMQIPDNESKPIEIYFLSRANDEDTPTIIRSPEPLLYRNLLQETVSFRSEQKIKIISEDAEARWLLKHLLPDTVLSKLNLLKTTVGCNEVLSLSKCDPTYFNTRIIVLDGDIKSKRATMTDINTQKLIGHYIYVLPSKKSIEESVLSFLQSNSQNAKDYFSQYSCLANGLTYTHFQNINLNNYKKRGKKREKIKAWFNVYKERFDETNLFEYWKKEHDIECNKLIEDIENAINEISKKLYIPE